MTCYKRAALIALAIGLIGLTAHADDAESDHRLIGFGTAVGGGFSLAPSSITSVTKDTVSVIPIFLVPTLEAQLFLNRREWSIDLTIPLLNAIATSATNRGFFFQADAFFNFNFGGRLVRLIVGPGLGFSTGNTQDVQNGALQNLNNVSLRLPAELGVELLLFHRHLGIKLLARPWIEVGSFVSRGLIGAVGLTGYVTQKPKRE